MDDACVLVVHEDGGGHILRIPVLAEEAMRQLGLGGGGRPLPETRSMNLPSLLIEGLGGGGTLVGNP